VRSRLHLFARAAAFSLGLFALLNLVGEALAPGFDANEWWIAFPERAEGVLTTLTMPFALALFGFAFAPRMSLWRSRMTRFLLFLFASICLWDAAVCIKLNASGAINTTVPLPLSALIAVLLLFCAWLATPNETTSNSAGPAFAVCAALSVLTFALLQMFFFGLTDYRRPADAIVVFGARTYADGRMSDALTDRVRTACELYRENLASKLIFSGGPGDGEIHETEAMRAYAVRAGVAPENIILDRAGLSTQATVENTAAILAQHGMKSVLCVSHFYHLPRVKLTFQRAGIYACTVPAKESRLLGRLPLFMARECAALLKYYLTAPRRQSAVSTQAH
jgi:uncharacterized SAM-binding protein YcdF (DUF218 family)